MSFPATQFGAMLVAAALGGGAAIGIASLVEGESDGGETQTVLATVSATPAPSFASGEEAKSLQELYETAGPGVVQVISISVASRDPFFGGQEARRLGSGFVIDKAGHIVTNYHVVEGVEQHGGRLLGRGRRGSRRSSGSIPRPTSPCSRSAPRPEL